ncbi:hypothetical protein JA1_001297 [Spathaspora sp. JA1]|nr:hypothetical protein JA1_001297 [Spathaspora sp. JA1]
MFVWQQIFIYSDDSAELKLKYQEIAALKKAISEKQRMKEVQEKLKLKRNVLLQKKNQKTYKNISLVINNQLPEKPQNVSSPVGSNVQSPASQSAGYVTVVSKGAMSFINQTIYNRKAKHMKQQIDSIKEKKKQQKGIERIQNRIKKFKVQYGSSDRIRINGEKFAVIKNGRVLAPLTFPQMDNPKQIEWDFEHYTRNGTGAFKKKTNKKSKQYDSCFRIFQIIIGFCQKGSSCKYVHDRNKIRICSLFLSGKCTDRHCLLSHTPNDNSTAMCRYFLENKCNNPNCKYRHMKPLHYDEENYEIWTCRPFALGGWCARGKNCPFLHLHNCPDFEEDGYCTKGKDCHLNHQITLRTQEQMSTRSNKYIREEVVVVDKNKEQEKPSKIIVSSYTVDPEELFMDDRTGNYQYYIDNSAQAVGSSEGTPNSTEFLIQLSDSESGYSSEEDHLQDNDDYVSV